MHKTLITIDELFTRSWTMVKTEWKATLIWTLGLSLISLIVNGAETIYRLTQHPTASQEGVVMVVAGVVIILSTVACTVGLMQHLLLKVTPGMKRAPFWHICFQMLLAIIVTTPIIVAGFVALIVPGVWLSVSLGFVLLEILDGKTAFKAIPASFHLVSGRWWPVFGRLVLAALLVLAVAMAVGFVYVALALIFILLGAGGLAASGANFSDPGSLIVQIIHSPAALLGIGLFLIISIAVSLAHRIAVTIFMSSVHVLLYRSLKETTPVEEATV